MNTTTHSTDMSIPSLLNKCWHDANLSAELLQNNYMQSNHDKCHLFVETNMSKSGQKYSNLKKLVGNIIKFDVQI